MLLVRITTDKHSTASEIQTREMGTAFVLARHSAPRRIVACRDRGKLKASRKRSAPQCSENGDNVVARRVQFRTELCNVQIAKKHVCRNLSGVLARYLLKLQCNSENMSRVLPWACGERRHREKCEVHATKIPSPASVKLRNDGGYGIITRL